jgi:hypothetical protein
MLYINLSIDRFYVEISLGFPLWNTYLVYEINLSITKTNSVPELCWTT